MALSRFMRWKYRCASCGMTYQSSNKKRERWCPNCPSGKLEVIETRRITPDGRLYPEEGEET